MRNYYYWATQLKDYPKHTIFGGLSLTVPGETAVEFQR